MSLKNTRSEATYVTILSDGTMRVSVPEGTENAVRREYETSDGKKGVKHELVYTELAGKITKIAFREGTYGKSLQLTIEDEGEKPVILSANVESNFGEDIMKKLPNVNLEEPITIAPYSFEDKETGKRRRGVTIKQDGEKLVSFYYDAEKKKIINGYPQIPKSKKGTKISKDEWKLYFMNARIFLIEDLTERFDISTEQADEVEETEDEKADKDLDDVVKQAAKKF